MEKTRKISYSTLSIQSVKKKLKLVGDKFTTSDLKAAMDERKVLGSYAKKTVHRYISKGRSAKLIRRSEESVSYKNGEEMIYVKTKT